MDDILITGCGRGLGFALLEHFLNAGCRVFALVRDSNALAGPCEAFPETCVPVVADVTATDLGERLATVLRTHSARIAVLINNAGLGAWTGARLSEVNLDEITLQLAIHCRGMIAVTQACLPFLLRTQPAKIVNITSRVGSLGRNAKAEFKDRGFAYSYRIAKAAQNMASLCFSQDADLRSSITCSIHPGAIRTRLAPADARWEPTEAAARLKQKIDSLTEQDNGTCIDLDTGETMPW